jgi:arginine decarboxylase
LVGSSIKKTNIKWFCFGGLQHCLIPSPKHILIDKDDEGNITTKLFSEQQTANDFLKILGYNE